MARQMRPRHFWVEQVRSWRASGDTCAVHARRIGVNSSTLAWWGRRLRAEAGQDAEPKAPPKLAKTEALSFVELTPISIADRVELVVGDVTIRLPSDFSAETLARVLGVLRSR